MAGADTAISAAALRHDIGSLHGNSFVKDGDQQDACDFLQALIKAVDEEIGCEETRDSVNHIPICVLRRLEGKEFFENRFTNCPSAKPLNSLKAAYFIIDHSSLIHPS